MDKQKINITLEDYDCADCTTCYEEYGTIVTVDGVEMPYRNQDVKTILEQVLDHLGYEVNIEHR